MSNNMLRSTRRNGYRLYLRHGALNGVMGRVPRQTIENQRLAAARTEAAANQLNRQQEGI